MNELYILIATAAFLGFFHTLTGPDHYLPFIVLSKARKWSQTRTMWITFVSGVGHIVGSVVLGIIGIALGLSLSRLEAVESLRGNIVGWMLVAFGILYSTYGLIRYLRNGGHFHLPSFLIPKKLRRFKHMTDPNESDGKTEDVTSLTPWILFLIFVFGPCEVLIPLLIFPAAEHSVLGIASVSIVFGMATVLTMMVAVYIGYKGISFVRLKNAEKYTHLMAGLAILISGIGIQFLGW